MKNVLLVLGGLLLGFGLLFMAQGSGLVMWPASSFMLGAREWVSRGALVAVAGVVLLVLARRR